MTTIFLDRRRLYRRAWLTRRYVRLTMIALRTEMRRLEADVLDGTSPLAALGLYQTVVRDLEEYAAAAKAFNAAADEPQTAFGRAALEAAEDLEETKP